MSRGVRARLNRRLRFPRVSGDEPHTRSPACALWVFSPRERG